MSYEPTNWKSGDTVTSTKLNKIEQGIANNSVFYNVVCDANHILDKTYAEIDEASETNIVILRRFGYIHYLTRISQNNEQYVVEFSSVGNSGAYTCQYTTDSEDGYPQEVSQASNIAY